MKTHALRIIRNNEVDSLSMKVQLAFVSLMLVASCSASSYDLQCTKNEVGVLWPIYEDPTAFYQCAKVAEPVVMNCNAGTQFTFVYQGCVIPAEYIPPPPLDKLPTDAPPNSPATITTPLPTNNPAATPATEPITLPTPQHPVETVAPPSTPPTPSPSDSAPSPSEATPIEPPTPPSAEPATPPAATTQGFSGPPSPAATGVPMPETPMPTPPVVEKEPPTPPPSAALG